MFAGYILHDLNQSHYLRKGSEMGAKFFTSQLQAIKDLKRCFQILPSLFVISIPLLLLSSHLLFFIITSPIPFSTHILLLAFFSSFHFDSHFFTNFFHNFVHYLRLYFIFHVFEHFYPYFIYDMLFFYALILFLIVTIGFLPHLLFLTF